MSPLSNKSSKQTHLEATNPYTNLRCKCWVTRPRKSSRPEFFVAKSLHSSSVAMSIHASTHDGRRPIATGGHFWHKRTVIQAPRVAPIYMTSSEIRHDVRSPVFLRVVLGRSFFGGVLDQLTLRQDTAPKLGPSPFELTKPYMVG